MEVSNATGISRDTLANLRCSICKNYLTVSPVTITSLQGNSYKCGRCSFVQTEVNIPASIFETLAATLKVPCVFPNCDREMSWNTVKWHEDTCHHQPMNCPCGQSMELQEAHAHFVEKHPNIIKENEVMVENPGLSQFHTRLIIKDRVPFLVYVLCERTADIKVGVFALQDTAEEYVFQLDVSTRAKTGTISISNRKVVKYNARQHCSDCLQRRCTVLYHKYQSGVNYPVADMTRARVNTSSVFEVLGCEDFALSISVTERNHRALLEAVYSRNERLRRSWECHICQEYLMAPIYLCPKGHSLCGKCYSIIAVCPYCATDMGASRNFALEEMAEHVQLMCQYEFQGCSFTGNVMKVAKHEKECEKRKVEPLTSNSD